MYLQPATFIECVNLSRRHLPASGGVEEKGIDEHGRVLVEVDRRYFRPTEIDLLKGDASKARAKLGWKHKVSFDNLVTEMVNADLDAVRKEGERRDRHWV